MDLLIHRFAVSIRLSRAAPARPPAPGPWHGPGRRLAGRIVQLRKERDRMSEVMADVGFRDMSLPDIGLTEVQVAELNAFFQKKVEKAVEETRGEMRDDIRDQIKEMERSIRVSNERAKAFQNMSIFRGNLK
jgi:hypothetical protein